MNMKRIHQVSVWFFVLLLAGVSQGFSGEVTFPTPSYEGSDLAKVREWEKTWVGKKVATENVDQVKEYLPDGVYKAMKNPELFGAKSLWFEVVPYRTYENSKGRVAATKKYAPDSKLDAQENLVGYGDVAGVPFPQPKAGIEAAWNFDSNSKGDAYYLFHGGTVVDCRSKNEREAGHLRWELSWEGRYDVPPIPKISDSDNPRGIARSFFQRHTAPADFVDTTMLEIRYKDGREEDLWVYTAMFRRVRRYATSQRTDTIDGTDMIYDDQEGWYTHPTRNTYKGLGRADVLVGRHQDEKNVQREKGQGFWNGFQRERTNNWVVEVTNKDKNYIYSKQIWYLDPESWQMNLKVMYNRQGELWKMYEMCYNEYPSYGGGKTQLPNAEHTVDFIRHHGSPGNREIKGVGIEIPLKQFTTRALQEKSY
jgi:hypothetical protein